ELGHPDITFFEYAATRGRPSRIARIAVVQDRDLLRGRGADRKGDDQGGAEELTDAHASPPYRGLTPRLTSLDHKARRCELAVRTGKDGIIVSICEVWPGRPPAPSRSLSWEVSDCLPGGSRGRTAPFPKKRAERTAKMFPPDRIWIRVL